MKRYAWQAAVAAAVGLALVAAVIFAVVRFSDSDAPDFDVVTFISVAATLAIALLTVAYVGVTAGQLSVMRRQLDEMARSRELDAQPLPCVELTRVYLERPRVFYTPPTDEYSAATRLNLEFRLVNYGGNPAVNVVVTAKVGVRGRTATDFIDLGAHAIGVMGSGSWVTSGFEETRASLLSSGENSARLLAELRERDYSKPPYLGVRILYRNLLGACFTGEWRYLLATRSEEDFEVLASWEARLVAFEVTYKERIAELARLRKREDERWSDTFDSLRQDFDASLVGEDTLELDFMDVPGRYETAIIGKDSYEHEVSHYNFGTPLPSWIANCPHADQD